jgi:hypothetical protein
LILFCRYCRITVSPSLCFYIWEVLAILRRCSCRVVQIQNDCICRHGSCMPFPNLAQLSLIGKHNGSFLHCVYLVRGGCDTYLTLVVHTVIGRFLLYLFRLRIKGIWLDSIWRSSSFVFNVMSLVFVVAQSKVL